MATLTVQDVVLAGTIPAYAAAAGGGDEFANDGKSFFHAKNGSGGTITLTFTTPGKVGGVDISDPTVAILAGAEKMVGPFDPSIFNNSSGRVAVTYSGVTSLTVGAFQV